MQRLAMLLGLLLIWAAPARADDISAAGRGVVRIVTIAVVGDEVVGFGHGSGFAVAPNRVVTNAHVVELALRYPDNVVIGVVPSEGAKSFQGRLVAVDTVRDLALIEFTGTSLPPLTLYNGPVQDGTPVVALGYPGNVDLATARSAADYILPQTPVRSQGNYSGARSMDGAAVLLHTANIAHGNSGGPLLDRCGRVLGVNNAITRADEGDSTFGFAIANSELTAFLAQAKQSYQAVGIGCTPIEDRIAQDRSDQARALAEQEERERLADARAAAERADALAQARARNEATRENFIAGAAGLLVLGALAVAGGGLLFSRDRKREAIWAAAAGGVLMLGAVALFLARPSFDESRIIPVPSPQASASAAPVEGRLMCSFVPERSRVTVSETPDVSLDFGADGCVNGRTQYVKNGGVWQRILVPDQEQTVSVLDYDPVTHTYTNSRYQLGADAMAQAREMRSQVKLKACSADEDARVALAQQQTAIRASLPPVFNERLVYDCKPVP